MLHWRGLLPWLFRAWPALALLPIGTVHFLAWKVFSDDTTLVNKTVGMALQVFGGLLVLYSVNDNLGLFRAQSLRSTIIAWFKSFPIVRKPITLSASAVASAAASASLSAVVAHAVSTIDERVAALERQIKALQEQLSRDIQSVQNRVDVLHRELDQRIVEASSHVTELSQRLEHAAVGGFKLQGLGVLLAIYGAVTSLFA